MSTQHILIVEDEIKIAQILRDYLENSGYQTTHLDSGIRVAETVRQQSLDLILLDVMLPGKDGMEICREVRKFSEVPIIMITARVEEIDRLLGLELGADDYICKPFSPREVVARVKTVLRRSGQKTEAESANGEIIQVGEISLDIQQHRAAIQEEEIKLTLNEFALLQVFLSQPNRVFSRNELLNRVQGYDFEGYERTIDSHVKNLRKKISKRLPHQEVIGAVYGVGYRLNDPPVEK